MEFNKDVLQFSKLLSASVFGDGSVDECENIDWDFVFACAVKNDVLSLMLPAFRTNGGLKAENLSAVEKRAKLDAYAETRKAACASKFLNALKAEGITGLVIKGLAYKSLYPYPELRKMSDLDLFVPDADLERVYEIAGKIGNVTGSGENHHFTIDSTLNVETALTLYPDKENALFEEYEINEDVSSDDIFEFEFYSDRLYTLAPTQNILYCAYHMFKHFVFGGIGARQMCDFALLASEFASEIDWDYVLNQAVKVRMTKFIYALVRIADLYFNVDVSDFYAACRETVDDDTVNGVWCDMLEGGTFGVSTHEREIARSIVFRKIKGADTGIRVVFPPLSYMRKELAYVDSCPVLLPVGWAHRAFRFLFGRLFKRKKLSVIADARRSAEKRLKIMDKLGI